MTKPWKFFGQVLVAKHLLIEEGFLWQHLENISVNGLIMRPMLGASITPIFIPIQEYGQ